MSLVLPDPITCTLNGKQVELRKLPLGKWALLASKLKAISGTLDTTALQSEEPGKQFAALLDLLEKAPDTIAEVAALVAPVTADEVKEAPADEVLELLLKAWQLNNLMRLVGDARKKAMGQPQ